MLKEPESKAGVTVSRPCHATRLDVTHSTAASKAATAAAAASGSHSSWAGCLATCLGSRRGGVFHTERYTKDKPYY